MTHYILPNREQTLRKAAVSSRQIRGLSARIVENRDATV